MKNKFIFLSATMLLFFATLSIVGFSNSLIAMELLEATPELQSKLTEAAKNGDHQSVRNLIDLRADVNLPDKRGNTPLIYAALWGKLESLHALVARGADLNYVNPNGSTALAIAQRSGRNECAQALIEAGAILNPTRSLSAVSGNSDAMVSQEIKQESEIVFSTRQNYLYEMAFNQALIAEDQEFVALLAKKKLGNSIISMVDLDGETFAWCFKEEIDSPSIKDEVYQIRFGENIDQLQNLSSFNDNVQPKPAPMSIMNNNNISTTNALPAQSVINPIVPAPMEQKKQEPDVDSSSDKTTQESLYEMAFEQALHQGDENIAERIARELSLGSIISYREGADGSFVFDFDAAKSSTSMNEAVRPASFSADYFSRWELEKKMLLEEQDKEVLKGISAMIKQGGNVDQPDENGTTRLMSTAGSGFINCVTRLIKARADIHHQNKQGHTAFTRAELCAQPTICKLLFHEMLCIPSEAELTSIKAYLRLIKKIVPNHGRNIRTLLLTSFRNELHANNRNNLKNTRAGQALRGLLEGEIKNELLTKYGAT